MIPPSGVSFRGEVLAVKARIRLLRSFDQISHQYQGFTLVIASADQQPGVLRVAIGPAAHAKHQFRIGDLVRKAGMLTVAEMAAVGQKQFEVVPEFAPAVFSAVVGEQMLDPGGVVFIERQHPVVEHISSATTRVRLGAEDMKLKKGATVEVVIKSTEIMLEK